MSRPQSPSRESPAKDIKNISSNLEFQHFDHTETNIPKYNLPAPATQNTNNASSIWKLEYYQKYFNVDTADVRLKIEFNKVSRRIILSIVPYKSSFFDEIRNSPDLYGPFWVATTVTFLLFTTGSIAESIKHLINGGKEPYSYDFTKMSVSATTVYVYTFLIPLFWWGMFKWWKIQVPYLNIVDLYGYAMSVLMPVALICIIPSEIIKWITVSVAAGLSGLFIIRNLRPELRKLETQAISATFITLFTLAIHTGLLVFFKFYFF
ncbi:Yip1-domain-containing protein [Rozella allomycis CSF55]|uniref:Protein YIP n=1 Tax=Rozella allomycis (strain CSF55) TaxID=988480 RepID=A0A075AYL1_ROZAC|nr:hypothetical protein O9G_005176 [Rozella allomycis CSF55]RKP19341.1 Yip1-domain-containing protein [Rozella allomycis CSF55]|eukprot:EPZ35209.1 hypothetical protein O9G_005176 [Rozella allomycis CSF55]